MYNVVFSPEALEDREWFKLHTNDSVKKKIVNLLKELQEHPYIYRNRAAGKIES